MDIQPIEPPFHNDFIQDFTQLSELVFKGEASQDWLDGLGWRLNNMPDVTVFAAFDDGQLTGYKAGYASAYNRYYSWLGAVHPNFQRRGIARRLINAQHGWLAASRFGALETQVAQNNIAMKTLNLDCGFEISGMFSKHGQPYFIMEKLS